MALLFMDGFDHLAIGDVPKKYSTWLGPGSMVSGTSTRFNSGQALLIANQNWVAKAIANTSTIVVGFACYFVGNGGVISNVTSYENAGSYLLKLLDGSTLQVCLATKNDNTIAIRSNSVTLATTAAQSVGVWYYYELKVTFHDSTGSVELRRDGVNIASATNVDTKVSANAYCNNVEFWGVAWTNRNDDMYILDSTGSSNNDFLGDVRVKTLYPTSDGAGTDFSLSTGTSHYALVDETTANTTDYVYSYTVNHVDTYGCQDLATNDIVKAIQVNLAAYKNDAGSRSVAPVIRQSATNYVGTGQALSSSINIHSQIYATNPATSAAWTVSDVNADEFGIKVTA